MDHLNKSRRDYALTGAVATSYHGTPRTTIDADFIVHMPIKKLDSFLQGLEKIGLNANKRKARNQLKTGRNIITLQDKLSPHMADFILQTPVKG